MKKKPMTMPIFQNTKTDKNIGLYVSPNQEMKHVNIVVEYLSQFGNVVLCTNDYVPKDLACLVLPDLSNIIALGGTIDAAFVNFFNKYIANINKDDFDFPVVGINHSCLSLWNFLGNEINSIVGHFRAGEGQLHVLNTTRLPSILKMFPSLETLQEGKVKVFSSTVHLNCMNPTNANHANLEHLAWNGANECIVLEGFVSFKEMDNLQRFRKKSDIRFVGLQSIPWLKTNFPSSFDYKVSGLSIGDHLSNSIFYHLTRWKWQSRNFPAT